MMGTRHDQAATAGVALAANRICGARLGRRADIVGAVSEIMRAWTAGAEHVERFDPDERHLPLPVQVAEDAYRRIVAGTVDTDPALMMHDALTAVGLRPCRVEVAGVRGIVIGHADGEVAAWRMMAHLASEVIANAAAGGPDVGRWATVEAFPDRWSPATWRVLIGPDTRTNGR